MCVCTCVRVCNDWNPCSSVQDDGVEIEGDDSYGIDVQFWWEAVPQKEHIALLQLGPLLMDKYPVGLAMQYSVCRVAVVSVCIKSVIYDSIIR